MAYDESLQVQEEQEVRLHPHRLPGGLHESELALELRGQLVSAMPWAPEVPHSQLSLIPLWHSCHCTLASGIAATIPGHCAEAICPSLMSTPAVRAFPSGLKARRKQCITAACTQ